MPAVRDTLFQRQLHELLGGRTHIFKALTERDDRKAESVKVLHHLHSAPAVECDLTDVEAFAEFLDELFDETVARPYRLPLP